MRFDRTIHTFCPIEKPVNFEIVWLVPKLQCFAGPARPLVSPQPAGRWSRPVWRSPAHALRLPPALSSTTASNFLQFFFVRPLKLTCPPFKYFRASSHPQTDVPSKKTHVNKTFLAHHARLRPHLLLRRADVFFSEALPFPLSPPSPWTPARWDTRQVSEPARSAGSADAALSLHLSIENPWPCVAGICRRSTHPPRGGKFQFAPLRAVFADLDDGSLMRRMDAVSVDG